MPTLSRNFLPFPTLSKNALRYVSSSLTGRAWETCFVSAGLTSLLRQAHELFHRIYFAQAVKCEILVVQYHPIFAVLH